MIIETVIVFLFISFRQYQSWCLVMFPSSVAKPPAIAKKPVGSSLVGGYEISNGSSRGMLQLLPDSTTTKLDRSTRDRGAGRVPREDSRRAPGKILPSAHPRGTPRQRAFSLLIRALRTLLIRSLLNFRPVPYAALMFRDCTCRSLVASLIISLYVISFSII